MSNPLPFAVRSGTDRTQLGRHRERGAAGRAALDDVLTAALICHLGFVADGSPVVLPTGYGVDGDTLYLHGSVAARPLVVGPAQTVCVTVTLLDGIVLARSAFHHSMNYRSAVIFGVPRLVTDEAEKRRALACVTEHLAPGQWEATRQPTRKELAATSVLALSLDEASVKVRSGPPLDDAEDVTAGGWAGVLPTTSGWGDPVTAPDVPDGVVVPEHVRRR
jgi:nitroimidazol reductase NimA-like FMN-containing flavoprotein (pyridoxamine 5'-phosphate oxidase superfamily)